MTFELSDMTYDLSYIAGETMEAKEWHPDPPERKNRPDYLKYLPSPAGEVAGQRYFKELTLTEVKKKQN